MKFTGCLGIMVSSLILFLVCSFTFFSCVSSCNSSCQDKPVITPSRLVVKFGDPASATCVACQQACLPPDENRIDMEVSLGMANLNENTVSWTVNQMTEWEINPKCFYTTVKAQCCTDLPVTVYKPPESVSFSIKPSGPLSEGTVAILQCDVLNVAPAKNLIVTFYRGQRSLGEEKSSNTTKKPVNEAFSSNYNISKEDNQVQFWCEAKLELGAEGPQPPLVVKSKKTTVSVHWKPTDLETTSKPSDDAPRWKLCRFILCLTLLVSASV
ncbi:uncharacterized protein LOC122830374 [Gambusia affinis]|uniref:uncharacterized protein LOC122830374 n=1 Tax=Gambusia affinis TaxID=33528 RepID=UPI001CDC18F7|nr:uncharacterized protein LOC122830374 [Gambusia affinis]